ncbi:hypothetical protein HZA38_04445 [Candidatus Peregrinibacteria bacterium]|nr:hypothetical protein [Candidatus Peregrinibacteria bacterium]
MKKFLFFVLVTSLGVLSSCNINALFGRDKPFSLDDRIIETPPKEEISNTPEIVTAEGNIVGVASQDVLLGKKTYFLTDDQGQNLYTLDFEYGDLDEYGDEGKVRVKGEKETPEGASIPNLKVYTIDFLDIPNSAKETTYTSQEFAFSIILPPKWVYLEEDQQLALFINKKETDPIVTFQKFPSNSPEAIMYATEQGSGTEISVGEKRAFRFVRGSTKVDIYIPITSEIIVIHFTGNDDQKSDFYDVLLSLKFSQNSSASVREEAGECGGKIGLKCVEGFRCELSGDDSKSKGICVKAENPPKEVKKEEVAKKEEKKTPEPTPKKIEPVPPPESAPKKEEPLPALKETLKTENVNTDAEKEKVQKYILENLSSLSPEKAPEGALWTIKLYEFSEGNLVSVEYVNSKDPTMKRKILFLYDASGPEISLTEKAFFVPGEESDWKLQTGQNLQAGKAKDVFSAEGQKKTSIKAGYSLYESTYYNFSAGYPKNYYYANLGGVNGTISTVAFTTSAPVKEANAVLKIEILDGAKEKEIKSDREILLPRDGKSHFRFIASEQASLQDLQYMVDSLISPTSSPTP